MVSAPASTGNAEKGGDQDAPHEQRHLVQRHAGGAHIEDGGNEVDGTEDRGGAGYVEGEDGEIHRGPNMPACRQGRIERPPGARTVHACRALHEQRCDEKRERGWKQPERNVVHARERHIGRADHQWHEPVTKSADEGRHDREKDHDEGVPSDDDVIGVAIGKDLQAGLLQLHAH
jgi:hypothetical protein